MKCGAQIALGIIVALALVRVQPAAAQFFVPLDPFCQQPAKAPSQPAPMPPWNAPATAAQGGNPSAAVGGATQYPVRRAAFNAPSTYRSNNQSASSNSVDAAEPITAAGAATQTAPGGPQASSSPAESEGSADSAGEQQPQRVFSSADEAHPSTSELGTISLPSVMTRPYKPNMPAQKRTVEAEFAEGLTAKTSDGYFSLTFHNLTQVDGRFFSPTGSPLTDSFLIPRQRWYVLGNVSQYVRYYTVINRGYNSIDLLDGFIDINFGLFEREKFQLRMGRMKTPYTYEYIKISENDLIAPERSVFVGNLAPNREIGAMAHGQLAEKRFEYALGIFNGPRRSFQDFNSQKDYFAFVNTKPFLKSQNELLQQINLGGSFNFGYEYNPTQPGAFRTASDQSPGAAANQVSPTFLQFNSNVFEQGLRMQWSGDFAYYYKSLGLLLGYQGGVQNYGVSPVAIPSTFVNVVSERTVRVPMSGFSLAAFYFITGEQITRRVELLEPRNSFRGIGGGGTGAVELFSRFANMQLGDSIFTGGLANESLYTNRINVIDNGFNWYLNHYTKLTFDWQYSQYGNPVAVAPTKFTRHQNIFWLRAQIFF